MQNILTILKPINKMASKFRFYMVRQPPNSDSMFVQDPCSCSEVHIGKAGHWYPQEHEKHQTGQSAISSN